jgi:uncharacterized protein (DUF433 family)
VEDRGHGNKARGGPRAEIGAAAEVLGLTPEELLDKLRDGQTTIADVAEQQNVELQDVIDAMVEADRARIEAMVQEPLPARRHDRAVDKPRGFGFGHRFGLGAGLDTIAGALGLTPEELKEALRDGKSLEELAQDANISLDEVVDAIVSEGEKQIDEAKDAGRLTDEEATAVKERLRALAERVANGGVPGLGRLGRFGFGMWEHPRRG